MEQSAEQKVQQQKREQLCVSPANHSQPNYSALGAKITKRGARYTVNVVNYHRFTFPRETAPLSSPRGPRPGLFTFPNNSAMVIYLLEPLDPDIGIEDECLRC